MTACAVPTPGQALALTHPMSGNSGISVMRPTPETLFTPPA